MFDVVFKTLLGMPVYCTQVPGFQFQLFSLQVSAHAPWEVAVIAPLVGPVTFSYILHIYPFAFHI